MNRVVTWQRPPSLRVRLSRLRLPWARIALGAALVALAIARALFP